MFVRNVLTGNRVLGKSRQLYRSMAYYPIDENIFGLNEEQQQVNFYSLLQ